MNDQAKAFDPEEMVTCPYEKVHTFTRKRMINHLRRCRIQHQELSKEMADCPYNFAHKVSKLELDFHLEICPDRETFYSHAYNVGDTPQATYDALKNTQVELNVQPSESWDIEDNGPTANGVLHAIEASAEERGILQNYQNITKSERRAKREEDREKIRKRQLEEDLAKLKPHQMYSSANTPSQSVVSGRSSTYDVPCSSAVSVLSDSSFNTALNITANRLEQMKMDPEKKPRGRSARLRASLPSGAPSGVGRGSSR